MYVVEKGFGILQGPFDVNKKSLLHNEERISGWAVSFNS